MINFKFFGDNEEDEEEMILGDWEGASWVFGRIDNLDQYRYEVIAESHYGIHSFLNLFPPGFVVTILTITGPNGLIHCADNDGIGWGFDITSDLIRIEWVRFNG